MTKSFLGRGWKFPVEVDQTTGKIKESEYEDDIKESIKIILGTSKGERIMRSDFGCDIHDFIFGETDATTLKMMESKVKEALKLWEPRVDEIEIHAAFDKEDAGRILINISYHITNTNNTFNLVYPFNVSEGIR
ncbi:MAG: GPW/gp25 family protein [Bacillota bacterium]